MTGENIGHSVVTMGTYSLVQIQSSSMETERKQQAYGTIETWNDNTPPLSYGGQITLSKIDETANLAIQNQSYTISM